MTPPKKLPAEVRMISAPPDWFAAFDRAAESSGKLFSEFVRESVATQLPASVRGKLSAPRKRGRQRSAT